MSCLNYILAFSDYLPASIGLIYFKRIDSTLKTAAILFMLAALLDSVSFILIARQYSTIWLLNSFSLIEGIVFPLIIYNLSGFYGKRKYLLLYFMVYVLYWVNALFRNHSFTVYDSEQQSIKDFTFLVFSAIGIIKLGLNGKEPFNKDYRFIFLAGVFISNFLNVFSDLTANANIVEGGIGMKYGWFITCSVNIIANIIYSSGFLCFIRRKDTYC